MIYIDIITSTIRNLIMTTQNLKLYAKNVLEVVKEMPDPLPDAERFSTLHSWCKHLDNFNKMYPILMEGEEPRNGMHPSYTDKNKKNYHWRFILEDNINRYHFNLKGFYSKHIPNDIIDYMKKFPIYVSDEFYIDNKFQLTICKEMATEFWNGLKKMRF